MSDLNMPCGCGHTGKFLRRKGSAVGLYCSNCTKWFKWVGKKDVEKYNRAGYRTYNEDYMPVQQQQQQQSVHSGWVPAETYVGAEQAYPNHGSVQQPYMAEQDNNELGYTEDCLPSFDDGDTYSNIEDIVDETPSSVTPCMLCVSGVFEPLSKTSVALTLRDGVISVKNADKTKLYGTFDISFCPKCGKKLV